MPTKNDPGVDIATKVVALDAAIRAMHLRASMFRPFTILAAAFGVSVDDVTVVIVGQEMEPLLEATLGSVRVRAWRTEGGAVAAAVQMRAGMARVISPGGGEVTMRWEDALRFAAVLPYPADVRATPPDRPLLMPSTVELGLPRVTATVRLSERPPSTRGVELARLSSVTSSAATPPPRSPSPETGTGADGAAGFLFCLRLARWTRVHVAVAGGRVEVQGGGISPLAVTVSQLSVSALPEADASDTASRLTSLSLGLQGAAAVVTGGAHGPCDVVSLGPIQLALGIGIEGGGGVLGSAGVPEECVRVDARATVGPLVCAFSRSALTCAASLAALAPPPKAPAASPALPPPAPRWFPAVAATLSLDLPEVRVTAALSAILAAVEEATREEGAPAAAAGDGAAPCLVLRLEGARAAARVGGGGSRGALALASCDAGVERLVVEHGTGASAAEACITVSGIAVEEVRVEGGGAREVKPSVSVREFHGRWSPAVTRCIGAVLGAGARDLHDLLWGPDAPLRLGPPHASVVGRCRAPLKPVVVDALLGLGGAAVATLLRRGLVVVKCALVTVDFPFHLVDGSVASAAAGNNPVGADADLTRVRVDGATLVVAPTPAGEPSIVLHMNNTVLLGTGVAAPSGSGPAAGEGRLQQFLSVQSFALESFADRVIELCVGGVRGNWSPAAQLRVMKVARDVTRSVWEALLAYRCLKHLDRRPGLVLNPPLSDPRELAAQEARFPHLLASGGDKANRLYAKDIELTASFADPGFLVALNGASARVGTQFAIADAVAEKMLRARALVGALVADSGRWLPDSPAFRRLFKSSTTYEHVLFGDRAPCGPQPAPEAWVSASGLDLSIGDEPLEAWLEVAYPLWLEDLALRHLRGEQLGRRAASIAQTNSREGAARLLRDLHREFDEMNAAVYVRRAQAARLSRVTLERRDDGTDGAAGDMDRSGDGLGPQRADKLSISVASFQLHMIACNLDEHPADAEGSGGRRRGRALMCSLDACPPPEDACFDLFALVTMECTAESLQVAVRRLACPIFEAPSLKLGGSLLLTQTATPAQFHTRTQVVIDAGVGPQTIDQAFELPRLHLDLVGHVMRPSAAYSPAYEFSLEEIAAGCGALYPSSMTLDPREQANGLRWWDSMRRLLTSRLDITATGMELCLLPSLRSFDASGPAVAWTLSTAALGGMRGRQEGGYAHAMRSHLASGNREQLKICVGLLRLHYQRATATVEAEAMEMHLCPAPGLGRLPLVRLPGLRLSMEYAWRCLGPSANYHVYPICCAGGRVHDMSAPAPASGGGGGGDDAPRVDDDMFWAFRSRDLAINLAANLVADVHVASNYAGACSPLFEEGPAESAQAIPARVTALTPHPVVCVYATDLGWLANWAAAFKRIPPVPYPKKSRPEKGSGMWGLKAALSSITLESLGVDGVCEFLVLDAPQLEDARYPSRGLCVSVAGASASMKVTEESVLQNPFLTGHLAADPDDPHRSWTVHDVRADVGRMEGAVLTGVRSDPAKAKLFLFSARCFEFSQCVQSSDGVSLQRCLDPMASLAAEAEADGALAAPSKQPAAAAPSSGRYGMPDSYLYSVALDDVRLCLTLGARNALLEVGELVYLTVLASLPDIDRPSPELLNAPANAREAARQAPGSDPSARRHRDLAHLLERRASPLRGHAGSEEGEGAAEGEAGGGAAERTGEMFGGDGPEGGTSAAAVRAPESRLETMGGVFLVRVTRVQVQLLEEDKAVRGCVIVCLGALIAQGWIGVPASETMASMASALAPADGPREGALGQGWGENETLQRLVRRELPHFIEAISLQVRAASAHTAPTDLDGSLASGAYRWLSHVPDRLAASPFADSQGLGVFRCIVAPVSAAECSIVIEHGAVPIQAVRVLVPVVTLGLDALHLQRVAGVLASLCSDPPSSSAKERFLAAGPDEAPPDADAAALLAAAASDLASEAAAEGFEASVGAAWARKQRAQWAVHGLRCLLAALQLHSAGVAISAHDLNLLREPCDEDLGLWIAATRARLLTAAARCDGYAAALAKAVGATKASLQVQPHMKVSWLVGGAHVELLRPDKGPLASFRVDKLSGSFANFLDWSGSLEVDVHKLEVTFRGQGPAESEARGDVRGAAACGGPIEATRPEAHRAVVLAALDEAEVQRIKRGVSGRGLTRDLYLWNSETDPQVRLIASLGAPLPNGRTVVKHFEVTTVPLVVSLNRGFVTAMAEFFAPPETTKVSRHEAATREAFLQGARPSLVSQLLGGGWGGASAWGGGAWGSSDSDSLPTDPHGGEGFSPADASPPLAAPPVAGGLKGGGRTLLGGDAPPASKGQSSAVVAPEAGFMQFQYLRVGKITLFVSYRGGGMIGLEDFDALQVVVHNYVRRGLMCTPQQLAANYGVFAVKDVLGQVSRNFVNIGAFLASKVPGLACSDLAAVDVLTSAAKNAHEGREGMECSDFNDDGDRNDDQARAGGRADDRSLQLLGLAPQEKSSMFSKGIGLFKKK